MCWWAVRALVLRIPSVGHTRYCFQPGWAQHMDCRTTILQSPEKHFDEFRGITWCCYITGLKIYWNWVVIRQKHIKVLECHSMFGKRLNITKLAATVSHNKIQKTGWYNCPWHTYFVIITIVITSTYSTPAVSQWLTLVSDK